MNIPDKNEQKIVRNQSRMYPSILIPEPQWKHGFLGLPGKLMVLPPFIFKQVRIQGPLTKPSGGQYFGPAGLSSIFFVNLNSCHWNHVFVVCLASVNPFNLHITPPRRLTEMIPFCRWGDWDSKSMVYTSQGFLLTVLQSYYSNQDLSDFSVFSISHYTPILSQ